MSAVRQAVHIRPAVATDADAIARLTTELGYPTSREEILSRLEVLVQRDSHFVAVAEISSSVVGWVAAERRLVLESGERAELVGLVVGANDRRAGIGRALVRAAEAWVISQGIPAISVRSNVLRPEAHPFYESLGYVRTKTQHAYTRRLDPEPG